MRDLTEEELKLAPEWATDYSIDTDGSIVYVSQELCWWEGLSVPQVNHIFNGDEIRKINEKPFNITKYEFSEGLSISNMCKLSIEVEVKDNDDCNYVPLHKNDVIAIAKALGVTGEDLK